MRTLKLTLNDAEFNLLCKVANASNKSAAVFVKEAAIETCKSKMENTNEPKRNTK